MIGGGFVLIPFLNIHRHKGAKLKCAPFFFLMMRKPFKVWASGTTPKGQTLDAYTPPPSRHLVIAKCLN